ACMAMSCTAWVMKVSTKMLETRGCSATAGPWGGAGPTSSVGPAGDDGSLPRAAPGEGHAVAITRATNTAPHRCQLWSFQRIPAARRDAPRQSEAESARQHEGHLAPHGFTSSYPMSADAHGCEAVASVVLWSRSCRFNA